MVEYVTNFYTSTIAQSEKSRPRLSGSAEADVCVIGAGFAGLTTALELVRRGMNVIVLEAKRVGWGASGRNGGFVSPGYAQDLMPIIKRVGLKQARELFDLSREGAAYIVEKVNQHGMAGVDICPGYLHVVRHEAEERLLKYQNLLAKEFDYEIQCWPREKVREHLDTQVYHQGWLDEIESFHIHPLNYALGLAQAVEAEGGRIFEGSGVVDVSTDKDIKIAHTLAGEVRAKHLVFCTSGYMRGVFRPVTAAMLPVATYVAVSAPMGDVLGRAIRTKAAISDTRRASNYYRIVDGDRLLWGGGITTRLHKPSGLAGLMRKDFLKVYPQLSDIRFEFTWSGLMGYAVHKMPLIGQLKPGIWVASAFGGHGLNTSAAGGKIIAEGITGTSERYRLFEPFGPRWAGGALGRAGVQLSYWGIRVSDYLKELGS